MPGLVTVKPEFHPIEEMKPCPIKDMTAYSFVIGAEKDAGLEDTSKTLYNPPIVNVVLRELQALKQLSCAVKMNGTAFLLHGQSCCPDRDETIQAEGQTETGMGDDLQDELSVLPTMDQLGRREAAQGHATQHKWPSMESEVSLSMLALVSNKTNPFGLANPLLGNRN